MPPDLQDSPVQIKPGLTPQTYPVVNLLVDVQFGTDPAFIERVRRSADVLRARGIPTIWISMDNRSQLYPPTESWPSASPHTRDVSQFEAGGFFGHAPDTSEEELLAFREHFAQYGPRTDEAMFPKAFFDAFATPDSIQLPGARPHYLEQQRAEHIGGIDNVFHGQTLLAYLKSMGVEQVTIMGGNADVCVTETAMGAARNGIRATILSDHIIRHTDQAGTNSPAQYESELRLLHEQTLDRPAELADYPTKAALSAGTMYSAADKAAIRNNLRIETLESFLSHPSGPTINRQQEQQQQLRAPTPVRPAPDASVEPQTRTAPVASGATEAVHSINGKIGAASIAINLADAAIKGDGTKTAEVGGTAVALEGGIRVVAKVAGTRAVPVVGQIVGAGFAGYDAYEAARSGNTTRAVVSGTEATLYTVAAGAGAVAVLDIWNPVGWGAGAVAIAAGTAAVTITASKAVYDNWNTVTGWFGHRGRNSPPISIGRHQPAQDKLLPPAPNRPDRRSLTLSGAKYRTTSHATEWSPVTFASEKPGFRSHRHANGNALIRMDFRPNSP